MAPKKQAAPKALKDPKAAPAKAEAGTSCQGRKRSSHAAHGAPGSGRQLADHMRACHPAGQACEEKAKKKRNPNPGVRIQVRRPASAGQQLPVGAPAARLWPACAAARGPRRAAGRRARCCGSQLKSQLKGYCFSPGCCRVDASTIRRTGPRATRCARGLGYCNFRLGQFFSPRPRLQGWWWTPCEPRLQQEKLPFAAALQRVLRGVPPQKVQLDTAPAEPTTAGGLSPQQPAAPSVAPASQPHPPHAPVSPFFSLCSAARRPQR